jgi:molybdopterin/thiamine biosynthesis adenylyltransferase
MQQYNDRFKDAPWYNGCTKEQILFIGQGGIGGNAMYCLAKTIPATYYILDYDTVDEINIGTQFFNKTQIGKKKVHAIKQTLESFSTAQINPIDAKYKNEHLPIMISGLDNMEARKQVFEEWKKHEDREIYIEARLRAALYEVYIVTKGKEEEYEKTLFNDSETDDGPCTFKQTAYFGMLVGARITHCLVNYLTNKYSEDGDVCSLPFKIQEYGEPFYIDIT